MGMPIFITRVKVGLGRGVVLLSIESPSGDVANREVANEEVSRLVMSEATFAEVTELFNESLTRLRAMNGAGANAHPVQGDPGADIQPFLSSTSKH
jgi:hypothetical protein